METINIKTDENLTSDIFIENNLKDNLENFFEDKRYFLITNTTLKKLYPNIVSKFDKNKTIVIKDGEKYKNYKTFNKIINELLKQKIERKDCIVALGGGVVGDLAGYCASSVLRGVELIQIPTTLLAMCDSSIGGKTGYNTKYGKNLVGSFYFAKKILIDPLFLKTLNDYEYNCGMGEILKYSLIEKSINHNTNYDLLNYLTENSPIEIKKNILNVIKICANLKAGVVTKDRKEGNIRKYLNFGHTFAHAFERYLNYKTLSHGQAVALGILCASKLSFDLGKINKEYFDKIQLLLNKYSFDFNGIKFKKNKIVQLMKQDKKVENQKINLLLPVALSEIELFDNINLPSIEVCVP